MDTLTEKTSSKLNYKNLSEEYEISIWEVEIDYCQCSFSFGGFEHRVYKNSTAIIKSMKNVESPAPEVNKRIEAIINEIIYN